MDPMVVSVARHREDWEQVDEEEKSEALLRATYRKQPDLQQPFSAVRHSLLQWRW